MAEGPAGRAVGGHRRRRPDACWCPATGESLRCRHDPADTEPGRDTVYALHLDSDGQRCGSAPAGRPQRLQERRRRAAGARASALRRARRAWPTTWSTACCPTAAATSGSARTTGWPCSTPQRRELPHLPARRTACRATSSTSARTTAAPAASCSSAGRTASTPSIPEQIAGEPTRPPAVVLTALLAAQPPGDGRRARCTSSARCELGYRDDVVTFEFAALDYARPGAQPLRVQAGRVRPPTGSTWATVRRVTYTNLDRGRLRAAREGGQQRRRLEREGPDPRHPRVATAVADLVGLPGLRPAGAGRRAGLRAGQRAQGRARGGVRRRLEAEVEARTRELQEQQPRSWARSTSSCRRRA